MDVSSFETWLKSEEGEAFILEQKKKQELKEKRHRRFEDWLEENDFDKLMYRLILEHNDDYLDSCYHRGVMPYPNNKLGFVVGYITNNLASVYVSELDCDFPNQVWLFKGYYFQHIHGQGTILRIYNKEDMRMLLQL